MEELEALMKQFLGTYYQYMQSDRNALSPLYHETSCMTFEGTQLQGRDAIVQKLQSLPFKQVQHNVTTSDVQPIIGVDGNAAIFINVMGRLKTDDDPVQSFEQSFLLRKSGESYYISNEIFRLVVHDS